MRIKENCVVINMHLLQYLESNNEFLKIILDTQLVKTWKGYTVVKTGIFFLNPERSARGS